MNRADEHILTDDELQRIKACIKEKMRRKQIALELNVSLSVITYAIRKHGLTARREWTPDEDRMLGGNLSKDMLRKIAIRLDRAAGGVIQRYYMLKRKAKHNG